jgi:AAA15 family ATPase/GTPase
MDSQNQNVLEFMEQICTDSWYIAFTPLRGWCVRISPKNDTFNDFVAKTTVEVRNDELNNYEFPDVVETEDMEFIVSNKNTVQRSATTKFPEIYANYLIINALIGFYKAFNYKQYIRMKHAVSCFDTSTMNNLRINVYYINLMAQKVASDGIMNGSCVMNQEKMRRCINYGRELGLGLASYYN